MPVPLEEPERTQPFDREAGIVFYQNDRGEGTVERLMLSLHSLRKHWAGEVAVLFSGEESPGVRIACSRYGGLYREVPEPEVAGDPRVVQAVFIDPAQQVREWSPYRQTLWVETGLTGREKEFRKFEARSQQHHRREAGGLRRVETIRRDPMQEARQTERRAALEVEIMLAWAATARVRYGATVVMALLPEDLPDFEKNWTATRWRHAAATLEDEPRIQEAVPLLLIGFGVEETAVHHAMRHRKVPDPNAQSGARSREAAPVITVFSVDGRDKHPGLAVEEPHWTEALAKAAERADTPWLIYLDPMMHPSPGAELFLQHRLRGAEVAAPGWAFRRIGRVEGEWVKRVFRAPQSAGSTAGIVNHVIPDVLAEGRILQHLRLGPSATLIRTTLMREASAEWRGQFLDIPFEIFLTLRMKRDGTRMEVCRPQDWGWNT